MERVPYSSVVRSLMYSMICTRPDLAHSVSVVSRFMSNLGKQHWQGVKWILRYLRGTTSVGLVYGEAGGAENGIIGYVDFDYAGDLDQRRSLTGYVFQINGCTVSWKSTLQHVVALSTTEAEYIALTEAIKEALWLKGLLGELGFQQDSVEVLCDSQSAIHLSKNQVFHERTKHIDVRLHFIREVLSGGKVQVKKVITEENAADMLTKSMPALKFQHCLGLLLVKPAGL